jgi:hypothetical protein
MGGIFGHDSPPTPPPPPPVPPAAIPPTLADPAAARAGANELAKSARGGGTVKTSAQGDLVKPATAPPSLTTG